MHQTQQKILGVFRNKGIEFSTSELLGLIDHEAKKLQEKLEAENGKVLEKAELLACKRELAKKHRQLLHHINKLISKGFLKFTRFGEKGEKYFVLDVNEGEEIVAEINVPYKKRIVVSRPATPLMPIEGYEHKELVIKFEPATFIDRLNSLIIFSKRFSSLDEIYNASASLFSCINDAICIEDFDHFFSTPLEALVNFIEKLNSECEDYGKKVSLMIDISKIQDKTLLLEFLNLYEKKKPENISLFFDVNHKVMNLNSELFAKIIEIFSRGKMSLFIKNKDIQPAPYFLGRAGPYCLDKKEWLSYSEELKNNKLLACSQSSVLVDIKKLLGEYGQDTKKFDEFLLNITKALLSANSLQRKKAEEYFKTLVDINKPFEPDFLLVARNYVRFWNYNISDEHEREFFLSLLEHAKRKIDNFCYAEETIYKSCGMPTRFKLSFACAFKEASEKLSSEAYDRTEIKRFEDLEKKEIKNLLSVRESLCKIFDGGDRVGIYRTEKINAEEIVQEIIFLLQNYKIPLLSYNFKGAHGNLKLTTFFEV